MISAGNTKTYKKIYFEKIKEFGQFHLGNLTEGVHVFG